jgi:hypothetical protein
LETQAGGVASSRLKTEQMEEENPILFRLESYKIIFVSKLKIFGFGAYYGLLHLFLQAVFSIKGRALTLSRVCASFFKGISKPNT